MNIKIRFGGDTEGVEAAGKKASKAVEDVGESAEKAEKKTGGLGSTLKEIGKIAGGFALASGLLAAPAILGGLADSAAQLELQGKKAATVFGEELGTVEAWAKSSAGAMGLTAREATNLATNMADLLIPMGMGRDEAAKMSTETLNLAGALSEWSGGAKSATDVADILTSAYLGETDGLKALGIAISAADVEARLAAKGQKELEGAALQQAQALAIQELILEKSTDAQKAFAEGSDSAARKQAEMSAKVKEGKEAFVMLLGPAIIGVTALLADVLVPALGGAVTILGAMGPYLLPIAVGLGAMGLAIGVALIPQLVAWAIAQWAVAAPVIATYAPVIALVAAIGLLAAGAVLIYQNWDKIIERFPVLGVVVDNIQKGLDAFRGWLTGPFVAGFQTLWDKLDVVFKAIEILVGAYLRGYAILFETGFGVLLGIFEIFAGIFTGDMGRVKEGVLKIFGSLWEGAEAMFRLGVDTIANLAPLLLTAGLALGGALLDGFGKALSATAGLVGDVGAAVLRAIRGVVNSQVIDRINRTLEFSFDTGIPGVGSIGINPADIPHLAGGGIVNRATLALIGESGPEAVVPLSRGAARGLGGGDSYTVNVILPNVTNFDRQSIRQNAPIIAEELDRAARRGFSRGSGTTAPGARGAVRAT